MATLAGGGFQFAHVDWHSKDGAKTRHVKAASHGAQRGRGWGVRDILAEAGRMAGHCEHVPHPQPPRRVYGCALAEVEAIGDAWAKSIKVKTGRAYRKDAPIMASGVVSFPRERIDEWPAYLATTIEALKEKYGDRFRCAVEHLDELHPHVHFYLVPLDGEDFGVVHDGYAASREARGGENKVRTAFKDAMAGWQDWIQEKIGAPFGLARIGPRRRRLKGHEWKEEQQNRAIGVLEAKRDALVAEISGLEAREIAVGAKEALIDARLSDFQKQLAGIERREGLQVKVQFAIDAGIGDLAKEREKLVRMKKEDENARCVMREMYNTMSVAAQLHAQSLHPDLAVNLGVKNTMDYLGL
jgi:hypothetical protein